MLKIIAGITSMEDATHAPCKLYNIYQKMYKLFRFEIAELHTQYFKAEAMKTRINFTGSTVALLTLTALLFTACAEKVAFLNSAVVPAAEGTVSIQQGDNDNYNIDLKVQQLAEPERLTPPRVMYVVWMETSQSGVQNLGQLKTERAGFSKMLSSSLETVTPYKPTSFFITAEDDATGNFPGETVVLKTPTIAIN